jgi:hypothetical protein
MLEIIALVFLCRANSKAAKECGRRGGVAIAVTVALWFGLELIGMVIGFTLFGTTPGAYVLALVFAVGGGVLSALLARRKPAYPGSGLKIWLYIALSLAILFYAGLVVLFLNFTLDALSYDNTDYLISYVLGIIMVLVGIAGAVLGFRRIWWGMLFSLGLPVFFLLLAVLLNAFSGSDDGIPLLLLSAVPTLLMLTSIPVIKRLNVSAPPAIFLTNSAPSYPNPMAPPPPQQFAPPAAPTQTYPAPTGPPQIP